MGTKAFASTHCVRRGLAVAALGLVAAAPGRAPVLKLQLLLTTLVAPLLQARVWEPVGPLVVSVQVKLEPDWIVTWPGFWSGEQVSEPLVHDETVAWQGLPFGPLVTGEQVGWPMVIRLPW
jgi:hypothetical protein